MTRELRPVVVMMSVLLSASLVFSGCSNKPVPKVLDPNSKDSTVTTVPEAAKEPEGVLYEKKLSEARPIAVMLDNHVGARPQAGLKNAEVVIEALAEGNITRYMAFFFTTNAELVGPVRSARPYFIDRAMEYDALYVHVGGSPKALSDVRSLKIADIDGLSTSGKVMWRKKHKKMPHNLYTSIEALRTEADRKRFDSDVRVQGYEYNNETIKPDGQETTGLEMLYRRKATKDSGYIVKYIWHEASKMYQRYINGDLHTDEIDQSPIAAKNVIVQIVPTRVVDDKGRLDLELVGSGSGFWLTEGVREPITWSKSDRRGQTIYKDESGKVLSLNPGKTWIQIVPDKMKLQFEPLENKQ